MKIISITVEYLDNKNRVTHVDKKVLNPRTCLEFENFNNSLRVFCHKQVQAEDKKYVMTIKTLGGGQGKYIIPYVPARDFLR